MSVRILIDAANCKPEQTGIRSYTRELVHALARHAELDLTVATSVPDDFAHVPSIRIAVIPPSTRGYVRRVAWREGALAQLVRTARSDAVLTLVPEAPLRPLGVPLVVVVQDIGPLGAPALYTTASFLRFLVGIRRTCRAATHVVCVSNATLLALHGAVGLPTRKCSVIGAGAESLPQAPGVAAAPAPPHVLYVGAIYRPGSGRPYRHKNVETLVAAF